MRELPAKLHEEIRRGTIETLAQSCATGEVRGESVLVIAPPQAAEQPSAEDTDTLLRGALPRASLKDAVAEVAAATGLPRRQLYQRALALAKRTSKGDMSQETGNGAPADPREPLEPGTTPRARGGLPARPLAESRAAIFLIAKAYRIVARRWKTPFGEIDIIARRRRNLVFVEVKARERLDDAAEAVTERTKRRILAAAATLARASSR